ncbi:hypothetical protein LTR53_002077 [Teratosphaeriaceae sp. CCFEE 6253]|nr:hypothetical protein LTR53_002077 [Teratosphaeriaceae sp. CCFEE 6253]
MGDEYDYDVDEGYDYDDGWMYVEDEFGLADELAESAVPDPGYFAGCELGAEFAGVDYDFYGYWDDLEYADDGYWEADAGRLRQAQSGREEGRAGTKRKRAGEVGAGKRWKVSTTHHSTSRLRGAGEVEGPRDVVVLMRQSERHPLACRPAPAVQRGHAFALLPDWRRRFVDDDGLVKAASMPADMQRAAEADEETTPEKLRHAPRGMPLAGAEEEWEDDEEAADGAAAGGLGGLDPGLLQAVLKQRLSEAGLAGVDQSAFLASINNLLSGGGANGDAMAGLADMLLGKAGGDAAVAGFLSQQGITLAEEGEGEGGEGEAAEDEDEEQDSAISGLAGSPALRGATQMLPLHPGSPSDEVGPRSAGRKKKKVAFDVPAPVTDEEEEAGSLLSSPPLNPDSTRTGEITIPAQGPTAQLERELNDTTTTPPALSSGTLRSRKRKAATSPLAVGRLPEQGDEDAETVEGAKARKSAKTSRARGARAG